VRQHEQLGFYGLFVYQKQSVNACINSRGGSTFTKEQFNYNRIHRDTQFNRLLAWLLIQLRDKRCLWTHLSFKSVFTRVCLRHLRKCLVFLVPVVGPAFQNFEIQLIILISKRFNQLDQIKQQ